MQHFAAFASILFLLFSSSEKNSALAQAPTGLEIGSSVPEITATTVHGTAFSLYGLLNSGPVVLVFYRGTWCPYCNLHLAAITDSLAFITQQGAKVVVVSPEKPEFTNQPENMENSGLYLISDTAEIFMKQFKVIRKISFIPNLYHTIHGERLKKRNATGNSNLPVPATFILRKDKSVFARHFNPKKISERMPVLEMVTHLRKIIPAH